MATAIAMPSAAQQWMSMVAAIWLQSINGPNTVFPIYSSHLKSLLSISQLRLIALASAADAGKLLGFLSGTAALYLPLRVVLLIGAMLVFTGYGLQRILLSPSSSYWILFLLGVVAGNGICWINTVCYIVSVRAFPAHRRMAVGLSTSYVGLSAAIYNALAETVANTTEPSLSTYLLLNAVVALVVSAATAPLIRDAGAAQEPFAEEKWMFPVMFVIAVATGACVTAGSLGHGEGSRAFVGGLAGLLVLPLVVPLWSWSWCNVESKVCNEVEVVVAKEEKGEVKEEEEEVSVWVTVKRVEFWLHFFGYLLGPTVGIVFLNNLGQVGGSRGVRNTSSVVSLSSAFGLFGRLLPPLLDYFYMEKRLIPSPAFMALQMAPMALSFFVLLHSSDVALYASTAVISACTGAITTTAVSATEELFGEKQFGVNHNLIVANIPIGSFLFSFLAALVYQRSEGADGVCMGSACYDLTMIVWGVFCSVGTLLYVALYMKTMKCCLREIDINRNPDVRVIVT